MAKKQKKFFDKNYDDENDDFEVEDENSQDDLNEEDIDPDEIEDEDIEENVEEVEDIETKLASGESIVYSSSEVATLLKTKIIYNCPRCHRIYLKNKWIKDNITDVYTVRTELAYCDKCLGKTAENFIGNIEIYDKKLGDKKDAMIELARRVEAELENREPFEIIIDVMEKNDILFIFTNTTRLALEIARAIRHEWHGAMQYEWFERNQFLRAKWFSEVQNREYFKSRIRAAKEKRIGLFSFEDE